jgi:hypothetical protein
MASSEIAQITAEAAGAIRCPGAIFVALEAAWARPVPEPYRAPGISTKSSPAD